MNADTPGSDDRTGNTNGDNVVRKGQALGNGKGGGGPGASTPHPEKTDA